MVIQLACNNTKKVHNDAKIAYIHLLLSVLWVEPKHKEAKILAARTLS